MQCNGYISHANFWAVISCDTNIEHKPVEVDGCCETLPLKVHQGYDAEHKEAIKAFNIKNKSSIILYYSMKIKHSLFATLNINS